MENLSAPQLIVGESANVEEFLQVVEERFEVMREAVRKTLEQESSVHTERISRIRKRCNDLQTHLDLCKMREEKLNLKQAAMNTFTEEINVKLKRSQEYKPMYIKRLQEVQQVINGNEDFINTQNPEDLAKIKGALEGTLQRIRRVRARKA